MQEADPNPNPVGGEEHALKPHHDGHGRLSTTPFLRHVGATGTFLVRVAVIDELVIG